MGYGCPSVVTTDKVRQLQHALLAALVTPIGAGHIHITYYHPSANSMVERLHPQLKAPLATYVPRERTPGRQLYAQRRRQLFGGRACLQCFIEPPWRILLAPVA